VALFTNQQQQQKQQTLPSLSHGCIHQQQTEYYRKNMCGVYSLWALCTNQRRYFRALKNTIVYGYQHARDIITFH